MDRLFYLFVGYSFIWILIFGYIGRLGARQKKLGEELELLKKSLQVKS